MCYIKARQIVIIFYLLLSITSYSTNCLKASASGDSCLICDSINGYYMSQGNCTRKTSDNCLVLAQTGDCYECSDNYKLVSGQCVIKTVEEMYSCAIYQAHNSCTSYSAGFFINDILFESVMVKIDKCKENESLSTCKLCENGYSLSGDKRKCLAPEQVNAVENCNAYHEYTCNKCDTGYYLSPNNFFTYPLNNLSVDNVNRLLKEAADANFNKNTNNSPVFCSPSSKKNCLEYSEVDACLKCEKGYILGENGSCFEFPDPAIKNCKNYNKNLECVECNNQYYIESPLSCKKVVPVDNCLLYDGESRYSKCQECVAGFYINSTTQMCVTRTLTPIENCKDYADAADKCQVCNANFIVSADGTNCEASIDNCTTIITVSSSLACIQCDQGYALIGNSCVLGTVEFCQQYSGADCSICQPGYNLKDNICVEIGITDPLLYCSVIAIDNKNCTTCNIMSTAYTLQGVCQIRTNSIENCIEYDSNDNCLNCVRGYQLESNVCAAITIDAFNCIKRQDANTCLLCASGYVLNAGKCNIIPTMITHNCAKITVSGSSATCDYCDAGSLPVVYNGLSTFCEPEYTGSITLPTDCVYANYDNTCMIYKNGKTFNLSNNTVINASACIFGVYSYYLTLLNNKLKVKGINFCPASELVANCKSYVPNFYTTSTSSITYVCTACKAGFRPKFIPTNGEASIYTLLNYEFDNRITVVKECVDESTIVNKAFVTKSNFDNCEFYRDDVSTDPNYATSYFACVKCKHGYTGVPLRLDAIYFIPRCYKLQQCMSDVYYSGLSTLPNQIKTNNTFPSLSFERYLSCHKCKRSTDIPITGIVDSQLSFVTDSAISVTVDPYHLVSFKLSTNIPYNVAIQNKLSDPLTKCVDVATLKGYDAANTFPDNCGAVVVRVQLAKKLYSDANTSILCVACKPMYQATMFIFINYAVSACTLIDNCESSTRFNGCSRCKKGYALLFDPVKNLPTVTSCVATVNNCKYATSTGSCTICNDGYIKHVNGKCYIADLPDCNPYDYNETTEFSVAALSTPITLDFYLSQQIILKASGCKKCKSEYVNYEKMLTNNIVCMKNTDLINGIQIIDGCKFYSYASSTIACQQCKPDYLLKPNKSACIMSNIVSNCYLIDNSGNCAQCQNLYYLDANGKCQKGSITNCLTYTNSTTCSACVNSYFLRNNICYASPDVNCLTYDPALIATNILKCTYCKQPNYRYDATTNLTTCVPFTKIVRYCKSYNQVSGVGSCSLCNTGYYLNRTINACINRTVIANCVSYHNEQDTCEICAEGYRLTLDQKMCKVKPAGVLFCENYSNHTTCVRCFPGFGLIDNECIQLTDAEIIQNCDYYTVKALIITCTGCTKNHYLKDNTCLSSNIGKCVIPTGPSTCILCEPKYTLITRFGTTDCKLSEIPNCRILDPMTELCSACKPGYYVSSDGYCSATNYIIAGCDEYVNENLCRRCSDGKILDKSLKVCHRIAKNKVVNQDSKCINGSISMLPQCVKCKSGYFLNNSRVCEKCQTDENCMYCSPADPTACLICSFGTFMNAKNACIGKTTRSASTSETTSS